MNTRTVAVSQLIEECHALAVRAEETPLHQEVTPVGVVRGARQIRGEIGDAPAEAVVYSEEHILTESLLQGLACFNRRALRVCRDGWHRSPESEGHTNR